jgi:hypothetical protein
VEPTTPCATNTPERTPSIRQLNFSGRKTTRNTSKQGAETRGASSRSNSQLSTPCGGSSSTQFKMAGHDPTIRLPEFWGEALEDLKNHLFICEKIWEAKHIIDEDTNLVYLSITLRDCALDWYMSLDVNSPPGVTKTIAYVKKQLINEF